LDIRAFAHFDAPAKSSRDHLFTHRAEELIPYPAAAFLVQPLKPDRQVQLTGIATRPKLKVPELMGIHKG